MKIYDIDSGTPKQSRRTALLVIFIALLCVLAATLSNRAEAGETNLRCTPPTQNTDGSPLTDFARISWLYGASPTTLVPAHTSPTCETTISNLTPGTWYFAAKALNSAGRESALSNITSTVIEAPPVPLVLKVTETAVYNTGSFSTTAWLVRKNRLYGTIPIGTLCDASIPAAEGFYRVPGTAVKWTKPLERTPYPLARCELR
jgi:hypothetical protein